MANENKSWTFNFEDGCISINFTDAVDIRKAFDAMKDSVESEETWLNELDSIETDSNTFEMDIHIFQGHKLGRKYHEDKSR